MPSRVAPRSDFAETTEREVEHDGFTVGGDAESAAVARRAQAPRRGVSLAQLAGSSLAFDPRERLAAARSGAQTPVRPRTDLAQSRGEVPQDPAAPTPGAPNPFVPPKDSGQPNPFAAPQDPAKPLPFNPFGLPQPEGGFPAFPGLPKGFGGPVQPGGEPGRIDLGGLLGPNEPLTGDERVAAARARAQGVIDSAPTPDADHPVMAQTLAIREGLAAEGLPTAAPDVQVHLLGEPNPWDPDSYHGPMVARSVSGPVGLGQDAQLYLHDATEWRLTDPEAVARGERVGAGEAGLEETLTWGVDRAERIVDRTTTELERLRTDLPESDQVRVASMSYGQSPRRLAKEAAQSTIMAHVAGEPTPLLDDLNEALVAEGKAPLDLETVDGRRAFAGQLSHRFEAHWRAPEPKARLDAARSALTDEVARAREANIYPLMSAGNDGVPDEVYAKVLSEGGPEALAGVERQHMSVAAGIPGLRMVGATGAGEGTSSADDPMSEFSSPGATIATVGDDTPVGAPDPFAVAFGGVPNVASDADGTSFSTPYMDGVVALMVQANPAITPDQIDAILDRTARDDPTTTRDGVGRLDELAAVRAARDLARP